MTKKRVTTRTTIADLEAKIEGLQHQLDLAGVLLEEHEASFCEMASKIDDLSMHNMKVEKYLVETEKEVRAQFAVVTGRGAGIKEALERKASANLRYLEERMDGFTILIDRLHERERGTRPAEPQSIHIGDEFVSLRKVVMELADHAGMDCSAVQPARLFFTKKKGRFF